MENSLRLAGTLWLVNIAYGIGVVGVRFLPFSDGEVVVS